MLLFLNWHLLFSLYLKNKLHRCKRVDRIAIFRAPQQPVEYIRASPLQQLDKPRVSQPPKQPIERHDALDEQINKTETVGPAQQHFQRRVPQHWPTKRLGILGYWWFGVPIQPVVYPNNVTTVDLLWRPFSHKWFWGRLVRCRIKPFPESKPDVKKNSIVK